MISLAEHFSIITWIFFSGLKYRDVYTSTKYIHYFFTEGFFSISLCREFYVGYMHIKSVDIIVMYIVIKTQ